MTRLHAGILALLLLAGILGVTSTYQRLSLTHDEPFHAWCGLEWWKEGTYTRQALHPPLARLMGAGGLYAMDASGVHAKGIEGLSRQQSYRYKATLMRLGTLPFYLLSCAVVFLWSRRLFGVEAALASLALYVVLSPVTAHAGLATTDMGYGATFALALLAGVLWLEKPGLKQALLLGLSLGLMIGTKFSGVAHWPAAMALIFAAKLCVAGKWRLPLRPLHVATAILGALPMMALTLALIFRFDFDPLFQGIKDVHHMSKNGFAIWLFGPLNNSGVWYFFPVVYFFKTPLPFHILSIIGGWRVRSEVERLFPILGAVAVMAVSMTSNINLGVRHVLPIYPLLAIPAGYALVWLWRQPASWKPALAAFLLSWQTVAFYHAHPGHISYFNELAGSRPEHISLDSDFDWGQDVILLDEALHERNLRQVMVCGHRGLVWNARAYLRAKALDCPGDAPKPGWLAISRAHRLTARHKFAWLDGYEAVQKVGTTLDLYYIPAKPEERP